jgi:UDP-GlcNAc:undecaprenyl-phosphate/decaprenyl-phosphate GlcNAc-1-phosphate transferase
MPVVEWATNGPARASSFLMGSYIAAFTAALLAGLFLTPTVRLIAMRLGAVDRHNSRRVHAGAIPRLGGVALAAGCCFPLITLFPLDSFGGGTLSHATEQLTGIIGGGLALCLVGAVDDVRGLRMAHKLILQIAVACFAYAHGFRIDAISLPFLGMLTMGAFALPITVLWIVGITNAVNLIDGLDGLAAGVCFFAALTGFVVAVLNGSPLVALVLASLMGVLLAFLFFNFNPARIFMGDSGSYFLGYVLATTSLTGALQQKASTAVSLLVPVIALGLPIFDTLFSMFRRWLERRPIFSPDRGHIHHRLLDLGLTHRRAVILLYGVSVAFAACSIGVSLGRSWETGIALFSASIVVVALLRFTGYSEYLHLGGRNKPVVYDQTTERLRNAIPRVLASLARTRSEDEIIRELRVSLAPCGMSAVEFRSPDGAVLQVLSEGAAPASTNVRIVYALSFTRADSTRIEFIAGDDCEGVAPTARVLLQLLVDDVTTRLRQCASPLVPRVESVPPQSVPAPAVPLPNSSRA